MHATTKTQQRDNLVEMQHAAYIDSYEIRISNGAQCILHGHSAHLTKEPLIPNIEMKKLYIWHKPWNVHATSLMLHHHNFESMHKMK